ncbi:hypothetical protein HYFRA_00012639 [Hymenoscyphus fraxineus]|uniref:Uncharacterized protein n=1 Tax=Hymenoscyphus fraxineus TaxID=746836 RepID=A0A9N9LAG4_9HELO|nr:hypothetical protein HYFRA_00012639 [Hymenoscyphus fraxineus]
MAPTSGVPQRVRNDDSWVEIASQPSSSSVSSIGDEVVTTGLRVQHDPNTHRRRHVRGGVPSRMNMERRQTGTSSQEEYDESESEDDRVMAMSNERVTPGTRLLNMPEPEPEVESLSSDEDDDENATALGGRTYEPFTPQPNAFSHPPLSHHHRSSAPGSYFPDRRSSFDRNPYIPRRQPSYNQADHDAALRASLTTLLSIGAAAARGKRNQQNPTTTNNEPMGLRLVPESELISPPPAPPANTSRPLSPRPRSTPSISSQEAYEKNKRKANTTTTPKTGERLRAEKKRKRNVQVMSEGEEALVSPTLLTWVVSAGVIVLVSVVGFGAGYVYGREVGREEMLAGFQGSGFSESGNCGREIAKSGAGHAGSLRRFKWGIGGGRSIVA